MHIDITKKILLFLPLLSTLLWLGCTPGVPQEQYNSLQAELKSVKEQLTSKTAELESIKAQPVQVADSLDTPRLIWTEMQPYMDLNKLLLDVQITQYQRNSKQITASYANILYTEQRERLTGILNKIDDPKFVEIIKSAWDNSGTVDDQTIWKSWAETYIILRDYLDTAGNRLSDQLK
jgi:hypothetical protein